MRYYRDIITVTLIFTLATLVVWIANDRPLSGVDDANIFFSYSENFMRGNGLRYANNPEKVEGFTSVLWLLICCICFLLKIGEIGVLIVSFVLMLITLFLVIKILDKYALEQCFKENFYSKIFILLAVTSPSYITWNTITLMDTCLWGFMIVWMIYWFMYKPERLYSVICSCLSFVLAIFARPEAFLIAPVFLVLLYLRWKSAGYIYASRTCFFIGLSVLVSILFLTLFRLYYFGYPLPNTFYAKVSPDIWYNIKEGLVYLHKFLRASVINSFGVLLLMVEGVSGVILMVKLIWNLITSGDFKLKVDFKSALGIGCLMLILIPVFTGGDHFNLFRFYQPLFPLICAEIVIFIIDHHSSLSRLLQRKINFLYWRKSIIWLSIYSLFYIYSWVSFVVCSPLKHEFWVTEWGKNTGMELTRFFNKFRELPSIGVITAGGIGRTYKGKIIDLMGLNNSFIAHYSGERKGLKNHAAFEKKLFFILLPDILISGASRSFLNYVLKGLLDDRKFIEMYRYGNLVNFSEERVLIAFFRKDFLDSVTSNPDFRFIPIEF